MARVKFQKKSARGERVCGAPGCGKQIQPGEMYYHWKFRYGGKHVRCADHPPKPSELTQSKMSTVHAAIEQFEQDFVNGADNVQNIITAVEAVAEAAREVEAEYREAADQYFGGGGPSAERADELDSWASDLEYFQPDDEIEEFDEDEHAAQAQELAEEEEIEFDAAMQQIRDEWESEHEDANTEKIEEALNEARELLSACPL